MERVQSGIKNILLYIEEALSVMASNRKEKVKLQILQVNTILCFLNTLPNRGEIHTKRNDHLNL